MRERSAKIMAAIGRTLANQRDEAMLLVALGLLTAGLWHPLGPSALTVPGAVLLWIVLPQRNSFVRSTPDEPSTRRKS